jgi:selenide, water dikinase
MVAREAAAAKLVRMSTERLTERTKAGGCASKLSPKILDQVLGGIPRSTHENLLVGFETADDAGVYQLTPDCALVQTVDFFTPMVDDPATFGAIAAANALSDVWAMGGQPLTALSVVGFPPKADPSILRAIIEGGMEKMREARCLVIGGHSVADEDLKFGFAVTGTVHPNRVWRNASAQPGDILLFSKRIGTGVITTALKRGIAREEWVRDAIASMTTLNRHAHETIGNAEVHGCTDVTGFGLMGHGREMALGSNVTLEVDSAMVPLLPGALECVRLGAVPGGLKNNREFAECVVGAPASIDPDLFTLFFDPQTSGGLLVALPESEADRIDQDRKTFWRIGRVLPRGEQPIQLI